MRHGSVGPAPAHDLRRTAWPNRRLAAWIGAAWIGARDDTKSGTRDGIWDGARSDIWAAASARSDLAIGAALAFLVGIALRLDLGFNGPYLDENTYLFVGRLLINGETWPNQTFIFSSDLPLWLIGLGDQWGGLIGARAISAAFGVLSLVVAYRTACTLFGDRLLAALSTGIVALSAAHAFISRFATYDAPAFFFFTVAFALLIQVPSRGGRPGHILAVLAGVSFAVAVLTKYVVVLYMPVLFVLVVGLPRFRKYAVAFLTPIAIVGLLYAAAYWPDLLELYRVQIAGAHTANATRAGVLIETLLACGLPAALGVTGWFVARRYGKSTTHDAPIPLTYLLIFALPMPAYHILQGDRISLFKHLVYASYFLAPLCALLCAQVPLMRPHLRLWRWLPATVVAGLAVIGARQVRAMEQGYPDSRPATQVVESLLRPGMRVLSEDPYLLRRALYPKLPLTAFGETAWLDNDLDTRFHDQDVIDAVWDGKFNLVVLDGQVTPALTAELREGVLPRHYDVVIDLPYEHSPVITKIDRGSITVHRRRWATNTEGAGDRDDR